ncbi:hypothetical protein [Actinomadura macrotermitis]|uniref:Uncharacterized protein n=1 Tax=Actinomadura macrotermitis TaxID=2585200 RepID=A0A7K0C2Z2_9ACTN|nr:hypothetical protein [Actinomadura macrotermitis]MQY07819.1 hypothetical protein [Actinomadura macrotermitis]
MTTSAVRGRLLVAVLALLGFVVPVSLDIVSAAGGPGRVASAGEAAGGRPVLVRQARPGARAGLRARAESRAESRAVAREHGASSSVFAPLLAILPARPRLTVPVRRVGRPVLWAARPPTVPGVAARGRAPPASTSTRS